MENKRAKRRGDLARPKQIAAPKHSQRKKVSMKITSQKRSNYEQKFNENAQKFGKKIFKRAEHRNLDKKSKTKLRSLLGKGKIVPHRLIASDIPARKRFAELLYFELVNEHCRSDKERSFYHVTLLLEDVLTGDEVTHVQTSKLQKAARKALLREFSDFVAVFEIQASNNQKHGNQGKQLCLHVHAIAWSGREIQTGPVGKRLNKEFGERVGTCDAVKVQPITATAASFYRLSHYLLKLPGKAKTLYKNPKTGKQNLHESEKGDRLIRFARLLDILSHLPLAKLIFAGGEGQFVARRATMYLRNWHKERPRSHDLARANQIEDLWETVRPELLDERFEPPKFD